MLPPKSAAGSAISAPSGACRQRPGCLSARRRAISRFSRRPSRRRAPTLQELARLVPPDVRAFMAARRAMASANRSLMRGLAGCALVCAFSGAQRQGQGRRRSPPCAPQNCRGPCRSRWRRRRAEQHDRSRFARRRGARALDLARDAAALALLYGSGLRISEALCARRARNPAPARATPSP